MLCGETCHNFSGQYNNTRLIIIYQCNTNSKCHLYSLHMKVAILFSSRGMSRPRTFKAQSGKT